MKKFEIGVRSIELEWDIHKVIGVNLPSVYFVGLISLDASDFDLVTELIPVFSLESLGVGYNQSGNPYVVEADQI